MKKILLALSVGFVLSVGCWAAAPEAHRFGCIPDAPGNWIFNRDVQFKVSAPVALPAHLDLRTNCPPVFDQGQLGSCAANAAGSAWDYCNHAQGDAFMPPSRLKIYYDGRTDKFNDTGMQLRDVYRIICTQKGGICPETLWPYDTAKFTLKPPAACYAYAKTNHVLQAQRVAQNVTALKTALFQGHPVVFGMVCYSGANGIESPAAAQSGLVGYPSVFDQLNNMVGRHAVMLVGWDDAQKTPLPKIGTFGRQNYETGAFLVRNSWGTRWGQAGYFWLSYTYVCGQGGLCSDAWVILRVE